MIDIVVPVIRSMQFGVLLSDLMVQKNINRVIVIDNTKEGLKFPPVPFLLEKIRPKKPMGVNESWMTGVACSSGTSAIGILNDDIRLDPHWSELVERVFSLNARVGVVCPTITEDFHRDTKNYRAYPRTSVMKKREGWCWAMRSFLFGVIPRIPYEELGTFCGDDWYWRWTHEKGYKWVKIENCFVEHKPGVSGWKDYHPILKQEKRLFPSLFEESKRRFL